MKKKKRSNYLLPPTRTRSRSYSETILTKKEVMKITEVDKLRNQLIQSIEYGQTLLAQNSDLTKQVERLKELSDYYKTEWGKAQRDLQRYRIINESKKTKVSDVISSDSESESSSDSDSDF